MSFSIKNANPDIDEGHVLSLWEGNLPESSTDRFRTIYKNNSYGSSWVWLATEEGEIDFIGTSGLCQRNVMVNNKLLSAGVPMDFVINKDFRGFGPALKLQRAIVSHYEKKGLDFIYAFPNKNAESIFKRIRYKHLGYMARWVKILRSDYKIRETIKLELLSKAASFIIDPIVTKTFNERVYRRSKEIEVEVNDSFDNKFDNLWEKARVQFNILGERNKDYLNWRYGRFLKTNTKVFCLFNSSKETLLGYVVYSVKENMCHIMDLFFDDLTATFNSLVAEFIKYMRKERVFAISVCYLGSSVLVEKLKAWGFVKREAEKSIFINVRKDSQYAQILLNKENWHLFEGDDI